MRAAVISDVHGNSWALKAVLSDIKARKIEKIINLGDCLYGPLDPAETADILMDLNVPTVSGNEDRIIFSSSNAHSSPTLDYVRKSLNDEQMKWLCELPFSLEYDDFFLFHGTPQSDMEYLLLDVQETGVFLRNTEGIESKLPSIKQKVILCGHDHTPNSVLLSDGRMAINPGSVGLQAYIDDSPYPHKIESGSPHARYAVITELEGNLFVENIAVPYDWEAAAETARLNGRNDWAEWLRSGRAELS